MPGSLPAVEQRITIQVAGWLAALDQVIAATRDAVGLDGEPEPGT